MSLLEDILKANEAFYHNPPVDYTREDCVQSKLPQKHLAIITCMDTRLVNFLEPAMGIHRGEANIIKTAGNGVTGIFDGTIRSLLVSIYELGAQEVFVIGHHECGMEKTTAEGLAQSMRARGIADEAIRMVSRELREWADEFHHPEQNVKATVDQIRENPLIPKDIAVHGLIFHPRTGKLDLLTEGDPKI